jgi:uncharacterized delta-60 repeat protein
MRKLLVLMVIGFNAIGYGQLNIVDDPNFNTGTGFNASVYASEIQSDGKILSGGSFSEINGVSRNGIARLNPNGTVDLSFQPGLGLSGGSTRCIAIQNDGKILVGGTFTSYNNVNSPNLVRLNSDGSIDPSFSVGLGFEDSTCCTYLPAVLSVKIQSNGQILVGGYFNKYNGLPVCQIIRLNSDGSFDASFNSISFVDFNGFITVIADILIQSDGKILLAGSFSEYNGVPRNNIVRLNNNGSIDLTFNPGTGFDNGTRSIDILTNGDIFVGGGFSSFNGVQKNSVCKLNPNGSLDNTFDLTDGFSSLNKIKLTQNNKLFIAGSWGNNALNSNLQRYNLDGSMDTLFFYNYGQINTVNVLSNNQLIVGGNFAYLGNTYSNDCLTKLIICPNAIQQTTNVTACETYTTQMGQIITQSGTYQETIPNVLGADSVYMTYNLVINAVDFNGTSAQLSSTACIPSSSGSATILFNSIIVNDEYDAPIISEYYSGSGQNHAIEIYNTGGNSIDIGGFNLVNSSNQEYYIPQNTIVPAHSTLVIAHPNSGLAGDLFTTVVDGSPIVLRYISQMPIYTFNYDYAIPITNQTIIRKHTINLSSNGYLNSGNYTPSEWLSVNLNQNTLGSHYDPTPFYSVVWDNGFTGYTQTNLAQGDHAYTVVHNSSGCVVLQDTVTITALQNDNISITPNPAFGNAPLNVAFANQTPNLSNYNFTWYFGDGTSQQSNAPFLSHIYTQNGYADVTVVADNLTTGCSSSQTFNDMIFVIGGVTCTHTATINQSGPLTGCVGDSILLSSNTDPSFTYQWNKNGIPVSGATSNSFYPTQSGSYTVTIYENNCPVTSAGISVTMNALPSVPNITSSGTIVPCSGGSMTLSAPGGLTSYLWNTGATTSSINVSQSGNYFVTVSNSAGCQTTSNLFAVNVSFMQPQQVCIVGMDSLTNENKIIWEKPLSSGIDSFYVYKETNVSNVYTKIGGTDYTDLAILLDVNSNPAVQSYRYKVSIVDTCGVETNLGDFHKTIHLTINQGIGGAWNLIWSHYEGLNFGSYNIYRGTDPTNISLLTTIQSNLNSYTDLTPPTGPLYYQIEVVNPLNCDPTKSMNYGVSRSNIVNNGLSGVQEIVNTNIVVYPNPTNSNTTLEVSSELVGKMYSILDFSGRIILHGKISSNQEHIDMQHVARGAYYLSIDKSSSVTKLIKQ